MAIQRPPEHTRPKAAIVDMRAKLKRMRFADLDDGLPADPLSFGEPVELEIGEGGSTILWPALGEGAESLAEALANADAAIEAAST